MMPSANPGWWQLARGLLDSYDRIVTPPTGRRLLYRTLHFASEAAAAGWTAPPGWELVTPVRCVDRYKRQRGRMRRQTVWYVTQCRRIG